MDRDQVKELFKFLMSIYPTFDSPTTEKIDTWHRLMKDMDFKRVMAKAEQHVQVNKFPPTISEIAAYAPKENKHLEKIERWKEEAKKVPNELRQEFFAKVQALVEAKGK